MLKFKVLTMYYNPYYSTIYYSTWNEWRTSLGPAKTNQLKIDMFKLILMSFFHLYRSHVTRRPRQTNQKGQNGDMYSGEPLEDGWTELWDQTHSFGPVKRHNHECAVRGGNDCCTSRLHAYCCLNTVGASNHIPWIITKNCTKSLHFHFRLIFSFISTGTSLFLGTRHTLSRAAFQI